LFILKSNTFFKKMMNRYFFVTLTTYIKVKIIGGRENPIGEIMISEYTIGVNIRIIEVKQQNMRDTRKRV